MPRATSGNYDLLALDLDGTLVDHRGHIAQENIDAIARARAAGMVVTICTGRALIESRPIIERLQQSDPVIVSGGAMVACPKTGETLERSTMDAGLIARITDHLSKLDHPALILKDPWAAGYDYLIISPRGIEAVNPASRWWLEKMQARVRCVRSLAEDDHPEHSVRIGAYYANRNIDELALDMRSRFGAEAMLQHFSGVLIATDRKDRGIDSVHIVELFNPKADKWQALSRLAARLGVPESRVAAVGDQMNDFEMIRYAGLGVAMGNADPRIKAVAKQETLHCEEHGVAHAIDRMLAADW